MQFFHKIQDRHIEFFLKICIVYGIILHIVPYFYNRSLWLDEAMLVSSICTRSLSVLVASPLDCGQSAPIGYLFIVKLITMVWNTSESALRIYSLFSAFVCMYLIYALLKDKVALKFALWAVAIFSLTKMHIYYGNEAKPYMSDNMFCLLVLYIWQKYKENRLELYQMCLIYAVIVWFSFASVFFIGACMLIECIQQIQNKKSVAKLLRNCGLCSLVLVSLVFYYFFWLSSTSSNAGGGDYWNLLRFPLIPTSIADFKLIKRMCLEVWYPYTRNIILLFLGLIFYYFFVCVKQKADKSKIFLPYVVAVFLLLIASFLGFYPIRYRLVQMIPVVAIVFLALAIDYLCKYEHIKKINISFISLLVLVFSLVVIGAYGSHCLFGSYVYKKGEELNAGFDYLKTNLTDEDVVYVHNTAIPTYCYKTDYRNYKTLRLFKRPYQSGNVIYGQNFLGHLYQTAYSYDYNVIENAVRQDAEMILKYNSVYLLTNRSMKQDVYALIEFLSEYGTIETVVDFYDTRLYHFMRKN